MDNLNNLYDALNLIQSVEYNNIDNNRLYNFNEFEKELDEIVYNQICEREIIERFVTWANNNTQHTFPKTENKWINLFQTQRNLRVYNKRYDIMEILTNIINKRRVPYYLHNMYRTIQSLINDNGLNKDNIKIYAERLKNQAYIIIQINSYEVLECLLKYNKLYKKGRKTRRTNLVYTNSMKRKNIIYNEDYDEDYDADNEQDKKKRRI